MKYHTFTLPNGLRIIHRPTPSEVVYCGLCIAAGSRHELPEESGMAHYCEHLSFKGTERRHSRDIINGLERLGGDLNAFTTKEHTTYYAALLKHDISTAIDLLCDMVFHSTYPEKELEKELEVMSVAAALSTGVGKVPRMQAKEMWPRASSSAISVSGLPMKE